jgi:hypothetical protein
VVLSGGFAGIFYRRGSRHLTADLRDTLAAGEELAACAS